MSGSATLLQNGFLCVRICGAELRDLRVDPSGRSAYKPTGFRRVGISGSNPSAPRSIEIHSETDATLFGVKGILTRERFSGTDFKIHETIPIYQWPDTAWKIAEGRALGQSFEAHAPFERAGVYLYAAGEPESTACRVSLKKEGPHGQTLASVVVRGMASTGWDCLPFGYKCAVTNAQAYEALNGMAEIEEELGDRNRAKELLAARQRLKSSFNRHFWDSDTGRYIGCVDANGEKHDYGFTFVNLFAMAAGLAELWQVERIYDWMENQPTATGEKDAYKFVVAPRANTLDIQDWWYLEGNKEWPGDIPFGLAFQNGGAFLFTSYYDILARLKYFGPDNAFRRYEEILARYREPDRLCGGNPLYHGEIDGYQVACSVVFPEAGLAPCSFLYGFLGVSASRTGLRIKPCLPSDLRTAGVRNIVYAGITLDLRIERIPRGYRFEVSTSDAKSNGGISLNGQRALGRMIYEGEEVLLGFPEAMLA